MITPTASLLSDCSTAGVTRKASISIDALDTIQVSNVVRQLLGQNNIGQRVFARCILNLSQGTVSELLSKPKPWSKLTEKGKESYRKMWAWAQSEESILQLKSISPRKGCKDNDSQKSVMNIPPVINLTEPMDSKASPSPSSSVVSSRSASPGSQLPSFVPFSFPSYIPSLLMQTVQRFRPDAYGYPPWVMMMPMGTTESNNPSQFEQSDDDTEPEEIPLDLSVKMSVHSPTTNKTLSSNKGSKLSIAPLTEHDFLKYPTINTTDLVQMIKDILSHYSISQRHFGEKILGLSQGSVSDILARPKSWDLLTQKGREPFIRMRQFLDDSNAIKQLVQSLPVQAAVFDLPTEHSIQRQLSTDSLLTIDDHQNVDEKLKNQTSSKLKKTVLPRSSPMAPYELPKIPIPNVIDTENLSSQVRELLSSNSIGQRVFGEAVLNLSQGTVSEILAKPRPWSALSIKGREPYIRMFNWFHDTNNVQKLLQWKRDRDALRNTSSSVVSTSKTIDMLTYDQQQQLKQILDNETSSLNSTRLEQIAEEFAVPVDQISTWLHHGQMRTSSEHDDDNDDEDTLSTISSNFPSFVDNQKETNRELTSSSSSKKRKSIPQKLITTKKFHIDHLTNEN